MTVLYRLQVCLLLCFLAGCVGRSVIVETPFDPAQAEFIHKSGTGSIKGQAFMQKPSGAVVYAAGSPVLLIPATDHAVEQTAKLFGSDGFVSYLELWGLEIEFDPGFLKHGRETTANARGRFTFDDLHPGDYFVQTNVSWYTDDLRYGGYLRKRVAVQSDKTAEIIVSGK